MKRNGRDGKKWKIKYFNEIDSTQKYLIEKVKKENLNRYCIWSEFQTNGIGTHQREWIGKKGNLFFSFVVDVNEFDFVPMQSLSVYFSFLMYKILKKYNEKLTIKWPNDLYILDKTPKKTGGVLCNIIKKKIICGIGINTKHPVGLNKKYEYGCLDIDIKNDKILKNFLLLVDRKILWENIFSEYNEIFEKNRLIFGIEKTLNNDGTLKGK